MLRRSCCVAVVWPLCRCMSGITWKNDEIGQLLNRAAANPSSSSSELEDGNPASVSTSSSKLGLGDIAFVMFLEPPEHTDPNMTFGERVIDDLIQMFSQKPTMVHVEVIIPPFVDSKSSKVHFATYMGSHASYQNEYDSVNGVDFYLIRHGHRWRCLPVFGKSAVAEIRRACDANVGSPYSLLKYPTSSHYFRKYSWIWKDKPMASGHCATLTARVLRQAGVQCGLAHSPPWYSPSSLYSAIQSDIQTRLSSHLDTEFNELKPADEEECAASIETILRGPLSARSLQELGHVKCVQAIRQLTHRVVGYSIDDVNQEERHVAERELGDAILKWSLLGREF